VLYLLLTNKISEFGFGDLKVKMALIEAAETQVKAQVTELRGLPFQAVELRSKESVLEIPRLRAARTEALVFTLGHGGYYGPAIDQYFRELGKDPYLRYAVMNDKQGRFYGMFSAREFLAYINSTATEMFASHLNQSDTASLAKMPGFVGARDAIRQNQNKRQALELMESLNTNLLPVLDEAGSFKGIVDRSRLVASLLIDVTGDLQ
jgi:CBS domain-containing protein